VNEDRELEFQREVMKKRMENDCPYGSESSEMPDTRSTENNGQGGDPETK